MSSQIRRLTTPGKLFDQVYRLMEEIFSPDVIEEKEWYEALLEETRTGLCSNPFVIVVLIDKEENITGYASGNFMPIPGAAETERASGIAALGHIFVQPEGRHSGHGRDLVRRFELECLKTARELNRDMIAAIAEVQDGATRFFRRQDYFWPRNVYYAQPPLRYHRDTGDALFSEAPENLMIRLYESRKSLSKELLIVLVQTIFHYWIIEKHKNLWRDASPQVLARIEARVDEVFGDVRRSINALPGREIDLTEPPPSCLRAQDQARSIALRELAERDLTAVYELIAEIFDPFSVERARATCQRFLHAAAEPLAEDTVYVIVGRQGELLGITGIYIIYFSTGHQGAAERRQVAGRLGWFGIRPSLRESGIGRAALRLTEVVAMRRGLAVLCIETSNNPLYLRAKALYEKSGYRHGLTIKDYFGKGRTVTHYWTDAETLGSAKATPGCRTSPLDPGIYAENIDSFRRLFNQRVDFGDCVTRHFVERRATADARKLWLIHSEFHSATTQHRPVAVIGFARYRWITEDVFWVRWIAADEERLTEELVLELVIGLCLRRGARKIVLELEDSQYVRAARQRGFQSTDEIPDVYLQHEEWLDLLAKEHELGLISRDQMAFSRRERLRFSIYSKSLRIQTTGSHRDEHDYDAG